MSPDNKQTYELLRMLFDCSKENALVLLDTSGVIIGWFGGAEQTFGYKAEEVLRKSVSMLFTPENLAAGMDHYEQAVAKADMEAEDDRWMLRKDGARFWATGVLSPIRDASGALLGFGKLVRDRTDLRSKTEMLEKQHEELEVDLQFGCRSRQGTGGRTRRGERDGQHVGLGMAVATAQTWDS